MKKPNILKDFSVKTLNLINANFNEIFLSSRHNSRVLKTFLDASSSNVEEFLPDGNQVDFEILVVKTDSSGNTVTIIPITDQYVNAASSLVFSSQGDAARLVFDKATQTWWTI